MKRFVVELVAKDPIARGPVRVGPPTEVSATGLAEAARKFVDMLRVRGTLIGPRLALRVRRVG